MARSRRRNGIIVLFKNYRRRQRRLQLAAKREETRRVRANNRAQAEILKEYKKEQLLFKQTQGLYEQKPGKAQRPKVKPTVTHGRSPLVEAPADESPVKIPEATPAGEYRNMNPAQQRAYLKASGLCGAPTKDGSACLNPAGCSIPSHVRNR